MNVSKNQNNYEIASLKKITKSQQYIITKKGISTRERIKKGSAEFQVQY